MSKFLNTLNDCSDFKLESVVKRFPGGDFHLRYTVKATCHGTEFECEWEGFETIGEALIWLAKEIENNLAFRKILQVGHNIVFCKL